MWPFKSKPKSFKWKSGPAPSDCFEYITHCDCSECTVIRAYQYKIASKHIRRNIITEIKRRKKAKKSAYSAKELKEINKKFADLREFIKKHPEEAKRYVESIEKDLKPVMKK